MRPRVFIKASAVRTLALGLGVALAMIPAGHGEPESGYAAAMATGRAERKRYGDQCITEAIGRARAEFQKAFEQAGTDDEKAESLLALGEAWRADQLAADVEAVRRLCEQVLALEQAAPLYKGLAAVSIGETWHTEKQYDRAQAAYARALECSTNPEVVQQARVGAARACLREGNITAARGALDRLLAMEWKESDERLRDEARALREVVRLKELWDAAETERRSGLAEPVSAEELPGIEYIVRHMRTDRPRLFLTRELLEAVKREGLSERQREWLAALKKSVDGYPAPPPMNAALATDLLGPNRSSGSSAPRVIDGAWGHYAAQAALAYLLTDEPRYYEQAVAWLKHAAAVWDLIRAHHRIAASRAFVKIDALSAYDWLFNDMTPAERAGIGKPLFDSLSHLYWYWRVVWSKRPLRKPYPYMEGRMSYSDNNLGWYLGAVFAGAGVEGVDDEVCLELMRDEYDQYRGYFRTETPEPVGLRLEGAWGYFAHKLGIKISFLDSCQALVGGHFTRAVPAFAQFVPYSLWNTIAPAAFAPPLAYGWSDDYHIHNQITPHHLPALMRADDLFAGLDDVFDLDRLSAMARAQGPVDLKRFLDFRSCYLTPASPLLMPRRERSEQDVQSALPRLPRARHFPDPIGQTFMNSGWGSNDTYALFVAGRQTLARKHYDENHFTLYKRGFLAMDTGTQIEGNGGRDHQINYYMDTIAHNCVLIRMEGERFPGFWGHPAVANNGGMNRNHGARVLGFETDSLYTYIASDATSCYHSNKAAEVVRQFLFVYPDYFAVFDRVESKTPDQKKTWLFHTQMEPVETGDTFRAEHREGAVCVRTLLPRDRVSAKIGGPGKEFWADGRNWPVADTRARLMVGPDGAPTPARHLYGQWRMEISAEQDKTRERFLHLIQAGERAALTTMTGSRLIEEEGRAGIEFEAGALSVRVLFTADGAVGGHIRIADGSRVLADRPLTRAVQPQTDLALIQ